MPSKAELFLDDEPIEMTAGVTRKVHPPTKHRLNPVLRPEHWWEGNCIMPLATPDRQAPMTKLVDQILTAGHATATADVSVHESEVDRLVCELYGLTEA